MVDRHSSSPGGLDDLTLRAAELAFLYGDPDNLTELGKREAVEGKAPRDEWWVRVPTGLLNHRA